MRYVILAAIVFVMVGCSWMFEKTDKRPSPISEALGDASVAYEKGQAEAPPIPGLPGWIIGVLFGGTAALSAFVTKLVSRKQELDAKVAAKPAETPTTGPPGGAT